MSISDKRDEVVALIKEIKEDRVRSTHDPDPRETNIDNVVHGWRGNDMVVAIIPRGLSRDTVLGAARAAAVGFGCDTLALAAETYEAHTTLSPLTGKRWVPGEMQRAVDHHGALPAGWVYEALQIIVVNRAADIAASSQTYRITKRVNALGITSYDLTWLHETPHDATFEGRMIDCLVGFMNEPSAGTLLARYEINPADFNLTPEQAQTHADCAVVKVMRREGFDGAVLLLADDPERAEIITTSLGNSGQ